MFTSFLKSGIRSVYNVSENPSFAAEPWVIYPAKHKTTGKLASVFIFDKTKFENQVKRLCSMSSSNTRNPKVLISECYELIKFEINQLSKLKHPQILTVLEVLEETKTKFIFATESVGDNLSTINDLDSLTIQKGLLQIIKGLQFLHSNGIIHMNLNPSAIFLNQQGDWKLAGFKFLQNLNELSSQDRENFYIMNNSIIQFTNLNLSFTAPELIVDSRTNLNFANDVWSLAMVIYFIYNKKPLIEAESISEYKEKFKVFERNFYQKSGNLQLISIPQNLINVLPRCLARYPGDRMNLGQFLDTDYFNGKLIKAMCFIDEFSTKQVDEKLTFLEGLSIPDGKNNTILKQLPSSLIINKLIPTLIELILHELNVDEDNNLIPQSLLIILKSCESISQLTFQDKVFTILFDNKKTSKKLFNSSIKSRIIITENLHIIQHKTNDKQFITFIKNIINFIFIKDDSSDDQIKLQETFLRYTPKFIEKIDFPYLKNNIFPLLCENFKTTTILSTKIALIETFESFVDLNVIDNIIITDQLFVIMKNLKSRDERIVGKVLQFYNKLVKNQHINLDIDVCVENILFQCLSLTFSCNCDKNEFNKFMKINSGIQKLLVEKKLASLSVATTGNDFESLIQNQKTAGPDISEQIPKLKNHDIILQPRKPSNKTSSMKNVNFPPGYNSNIVLSPKHNVNSFSDSLI
ncbi:unnamed protein product [Candida verbasci]|uniref:Protein kinase domain-containing protein n=1 Tax=Candida verbasci TaxID=1227364 RepID=A0A9W4TX47_9ASCO|nr:unnamed protein product [Candida verbasci]